MKEESIELMSYYDVIIKNEYITQNSDTLVVILPGGAYTNYAPLMHYSYRTALELGTDIICINYGFQIANKEFNISSELEIITIESSQILNKCLKKDYKKIVFIGKCIGTIIQNILSKELNDFNQCHIYLTPIDLTFERILSEPCLIITGTNDNGVSTDIINKVAQNSNYELVRIIGGDHSLETTEVTKSIEILGAIMIKLKEFIKKNI